MGLEAIFPKPRLSIPDPVAGKYPYLLRGLSVERPDQVWCADITYIGLEAGAAAARNSVQWRRRRFQLWVMASLMRSPAGKP